MKQNKTTKLKTVALVATLLTAVVILSSCEWLKSFLPPKPQEGEKAVAVYVVDAVAVDGVLTGEAAKYELKTDAGYVRGFLEELKDQKGVSYNGNESPWGGFFIDQIDGVTLDEGFYIWICLRLSNDEVVDTIMDADDSYEYDGKIFYSAIVGVDLIPLSDGMEILFFKVYWGVY
jgi:hypothetical protein